MRKAPRWDTLATALCLLLAAHIADCEPAHAEEQALQWSPLAPDLEQANTPLNPDSVLSASVVLIRSSLSRFRVQVIRAGDFGQKRASAKSLCRESGASVCINSNFFDEQGRALGLVMSRGIIHQKIHRGGGTLTGIFFATPKSIGIAHRDLFSPTGVVEATQAGPRLIAEGKIVEGLKESSFRTNLSGVCIDHSGRAILYRATGGVFGSSLPLLQRVLLSPSVGCVEALNFDGGGSSQLYIAGEVPGHAGAEREENFPGRDDVPVVVALIPLKASGHSPR